MASESLTQKTAQVSRGYTYSYYAAAPKQADRPTVLLVHGWPDEGAMWLDLATEHLLPAGYGVIIPDMLGYGGTSKERDPKQYRMPLIVKDIEDVLDAEGVDVVVSAGHDWGSIIAQHVYAYAPQRTIALAIVSVAYSPPPRSPDEARTLAQLNDVHERGYGMRCFEYMNFFASDESDEVFERHLEAAFHLCYSDNYARMSREVMTQPGKPRESLEKDTLFPLHPSVTPAQKERWIARYRRDGFNGPFNYYRVFVHAQQYQDESTDVAAPLAGPRVEVPTLYVGYKDDLLCRKENILLAQKAGLLPHLTNKTLDGGHWGLIQDPKPFGDAFVAWLQESGGMGKGK